ncbi:MULTISPECIES: AAA-type ATPase lid domain-containing protein [Gracilibacillus]|uniref:helix-turn-helix domain-containing protein n=1 Tax=Gracilibacillus TaxID=74385 RepID=UPI00137289EC|nr:MULTISPECIES: helix-turn-helix domain-containing protein [Gracilibacillus]
MKITANIFSRYHDVLNQLTIAVVVTDKTGVVIYTNQTALTMFERASLKDVKLTELLKAPCIEEVKRVHHPLDRLDRIKTTGQKVINNYAPFLDEKGRLQGILLSIETAKSFQDRERAIHDTDLEKEIFEQLLVSSQHEFRVLLADQQVWLTSKHWDEVIRQASPYMISLANQQATEVLTSRREKKETTLPTTAAKTDKVQLISRPLQRNGKLLGCMQYVLTDPSHEWRSELELAKKVIRKIEKTEQIKDIAGEHHVVEIAREQARLYAKMDTTIVIRGDKGTGKKMLARAIHQASRQAIHPFIIQHFSQMEDHSVSKLKENMEFGTIYFHIDEGLSKQKQMQLLHFLQEQKSVRCIFGTEKLLIPELWHAPLYEYLQSYQMMLPALQERLEDMETLVEVFVQQMNLQFGFTIKSVDQQVLTYWKGLNWPGNVAQLRQTVEQTIWNLDVSDHVITVDHLPGETYSAQQLQQTERPSLQNAMDQFEQNYIYETLEAHHFNKTQTAKALGVSVRNLYYKMDKYQMDRGVT